MATKQTVVIKDNNPSVITTANKGTPVNVTRPIVKPVTSYSSGVSGTHNDNYIGTLDDKYIGSAAASANLRDRGYPSSMDSYSGGVGAVNPGVKPGTITTPTKTGSGSGSGSGATSGGASAYSSLLNAYLNQGRSFADEQYAAQKAAAQNAYDKSMSALNNAYDSQVSNLKNKYDFTVGQLNSSYDNSAGKINANAEDSLRQAYINRMLSQKNLGQQMSALGLNGGATETTLANMLNNYGNARNNIETTRANNLSDLAFTRDNNLAEALQNYNSALANADAQRQAQIMNLENALANNQISALGDYYGALSNENDNYMALMRSLIGNMGDYKWTPAEVTNLVNQINTTQASPDASSNYNAALQNMLNASAVGVNGGAPSTSANTDANALMLQALRKQLLA